VSTVLPGERGDGKIQGWHRDRLAVIYVRQSSRQQVADHGESTRLQYGLTGRAAALGWAASRVMVIDEDLGRSAANAAERPGFARLVAEITMGHVGLVLGLEMSRLARAGRDWHQLIELCSLAGALLADADGVYDPNWYNDRLLLGLKGTMTELELHLIRQRMASGRLAKAGRGELAIPLPAGYARRPSGEVALDPDEQVQAVVRLVFSVFEQLGTVHAVLRFLAPARGKSPGGHRTSRAWSTCCATRRMPGSTLTGAAARTGPGGCPGTSIPAGCAVWTPGSGWSASRARCRPISAWTSMSATRRGWLPTGPGREPGRAA
jgi:DNA invertase Pin-like site-specific DNA recombinase